MGRHKGVYYTKESSRSKFPNHNPLDTRFVQLNCGIIVVEDDYLHQFAIAVSINEYHDNPS